MVALFNAHCKESACKIVHIIAEFGVGASIVELGITECVLVRKLLADTVEDIGEGVVEYLLLRPRILSITAHIGLQRVLVLLFVRSHVLGELRNDNAGIAEVLSPTLYPFEGDVAVVVDRLKRRYHLLYGNVSSAHDAVLNSAVGTHYAVLDLNVLDELAEVRNGSFGSFVVVTVGVVHIPQRRDLSAADLVEKCGKAGCVAVDAVCLNEEGDVVLLRNGNKLAECFCDIIVIDLTAGCRFKVSEYSYVRCAELLSKLRVSLYFVLCFLILVLEFKTGTGGKTGYFKSE